MYKKKKKMVLEELKSNLPIGILSLFLAIRKNGLGWSVHGLGESFDV